MNEILLWSIRALRLSAENKHTGLKDLSQCHFVNYKSHTNCPGIEPRPLVVGVWLNTSHNAYCSSGVSTNFSIYTHTIANLEWLRCAREMLQNSAEKFLMTFKMFRDVRDFRFLPQCTWDLHSPYFLQGASIPVHGSLAPWRPICFPEISVNNYWSALS